MTLKELAYSLQQRLQEKNSIPFKRAHMHELMASAFGFNSYAAFRATQVFRRWQRNYPPDFSDSSATKRLLELGCPAPEVAQATATLLTCLRDYRIGAQPMAKLLAELDADAEADIDDDLVGVWDDPDGDSILQSFLEHLARNGNVDAQYALEIIPGTEQWLLASAEGGDTTSIRELALRCQEEDPFQCWIWIYFAEHFGEDLTKDHYIGIHEDGSPYDDDVGGPIYADGHDGLCPAPLTPADDIRARQEAKQLYVESQGG